MTFLRLPTCLIVAPIALTTVAVLQKPVIVDDVLSRVVAYLSDYEQKLSAVVAVETYEQRHQYHIMKGAPTTTRKRVLKSDFVFLRLPGGADWLGFRDTFLVDGKPVRDRTSRVLELLSAGSSDTVAEAVRVVTENARYNLGDISRTINAPTQTLDLLRDLSRFRFRRAGEDTLEGRRFWKIEFRETRRPSIIRTREGADQLSTGAVWVDPATGAIAKTVLNIGGDRSADFVQTKITVTYVVDPKLGFFVPAEMVEHYYRPSDANHTSVVIDAVATYTEFRQFQTTGRIVTDR